MHTHKGDSKVRKRPTNHNGNEAVAIPGDSPSPSQLKAELTGCTVGR